MSLTKTTFSMIDGAPINVKDFGAVGDGITDDSSAIQSAINYAASLIVNPYPSVSNDTSAAVPILYFESKQYNINEPLVIPSRLMIQGNKCILYSVSGVTIFTSTSGYRIQVNDVIFAGIGSKAIDFNLSNLDVARFEFNGCEFSTQNVDVGNYSVTIVSQSSQALFNGCTVAAAPNFLDANCDFVSINNSWINGWSALSPVPNTKPANTCSIINRGRSIHLTNNVFIPEQAVSGVRANVRWIDNYGVLTAKDCYFGGENGGFPIIYEYVTGIGSNSNNAQILIEGCQISAGPSTVGGGGVVILMPNILPGRYTFSNNNFLVNSPLISSQGYDFTKTIAQTNELLRLNLYSQSNSDLLENIQIFYDGVSLPPIISNPLHPFIKQNSDLLGGVGAAATVNYTVVDVLKSQQGSDSDYGANSFKVKIKISGAVSGPKIVTQEKEYFVQVAWQAGNSPNVSITPGTFTEYAPYGGGLGDVLISFTQISGSTSTGTSFQMNIASGLSYLQTSWLVYEIDSVGSSGQVLYRDY
jgi:Pectate lyase superfamily protein